MFDAHWMAMFSTLVPAMLVVAGAIGLMAARFMSRRSARQIARLTADKADLETAKREIEQTAFELKRSLRLAEDTNRAKTQFLAAMSHELRTPLNAIIGFSELLTSGIYGPLGDDHYAGYARDVHDSGKYLLGLINDVLDMSKLDASVVDTYAEPLELSEFLRKTLQMVRPQADRGGVVLTESFNTALPGMRTDERRLRQVLLNLLSNAVKFTAVGGTVSISAYRQGGGVAITVADTGIGMAAEDIPKAMENFGQVQTGWSRNVEGTGLGLPLSKRLVELLGGSFVLESKLGVGTTVILTFPPERLLEVPLAA
ncbi:MAG: sensor histidine kinase [Stellaceae bacterium]